MQFDGVIFDFNGVLWWDGPLHEDAWRAYSARLRGRALTDDEMVHHVHGRVNGDILGYLLGRALSADEVDRLAEEKETLYRAACLAQGSDFALSPGATDLLDYLKASSIARTIATSSAWPNLSFFIEHLELARWFDRGRIVYDDGSHQGKPAPDPYRLAAAALGLAPRQCVVVEDSRSGITAARMAGIGHVIAIGDAAMQAVPGVDRVIPSLAAFPRDILRPPAAI